MRRILFHIPPEVSGIPVFGPVVDGSVTRGPGLLLAVWVLFGLGLLLWLGWRQGFNADTWSYLPVVLLVGAIIWGVLPAVCDENGFPVRGYGVMLLAAVVAGTGLLLWRARRLGLDPDRTLSLSFWVVVPGLVGARAFHVIEYWNTTYWPVYANAEKPTEGLGAILAALINITEGGVVAYGGFIGGVAGLLLFVRKHRLPLLATCDLVAPCLVLGLALGRIGCLLNGCCFGGLCEYPWAVTFPAGPWPYGPCYRAQVERGQMWAPKLGFELSDDPKAAPVVQSVDPRSPALRSEPREQPTANGPGELRPGDRLERIGGYEVGTAGYARLILWKLFDQDQPVVLQAEGRGPVKLPPVSVPPRSRPVHPTQIYSSINAALLCLLLLAYDPFRRRDGELFALLISIYPIARFLLEMIRTDEPDIGITGMTISQNLSLALLVCAAGMWFYVLGRPRGKAFG